MSEKDKRFFLGVLVGIVFTILLSYDHYVREDSMLQHIKIYKACVEDTAMESYCRDKVIDEDLRKFLDEGSLIYMKKTKKQKRNTDEKCY